MFMISLPDESQSSLRLRYTIGIRSGYLEKTSLLPIKARNTPYFHFLPAAENARQGKTGTRKRPSEKGRGTQNGFWHYGKLSVFCKTREKIFLRTRGMCQLRAATAAAASRGIGRNADHVLRVVRIDIARFGRYGGSAWVTRYIGDIHAGTTRNEQGKGKGRQNGAQHDFILSMEPTESRPL
jgi:hypothetical protein